MRRTTIILLFVLVFSVALFVGVVYWRQIKTEDLDRTAETLTEIDAEMEKSQN